jgi:hypothetical protein
MKDLVLQDIELCDAVRGVMERLNIPADMWIVGDGFFTNEEFCMGTIPGYAKMSASKTWRQDKLALGLPEWWDEPLGGIGADPYQARVEINGKLKSLDFGRKYLTIRDKLHASRGQPQLEATARLLILLDKENLL